MTYKHRSTPSLQDHPYPLALTWKGGPVTTVPSHNIFKFIRIFIRICSCYVTSTQVAIPPNTAVGALCSMQYAYLYQVISILSHPTNRRTINENRRQPPCSWTTEPPSHRAVKPPPSRQNVTEQRQQNQYNAQHPRPRPRPHTCTYKYTHTSTCTCTCT